MEWDDENEYRTRKGPLDFANGEVDAGYYAENLPEEFYFVWHVRKQTDGYYRVVIDFFLPWDAADLTWDYEWPNRMIAAIWARKAVRKLAAVERAYVLKHGVSPGVIDAVEQAMNQGIHDSAEYRPGPKVRKQDWSTRQKKTHQRRR